MSEADAERDAPLAFFEPELDRHARLKPSSPSSRGPASARPRSGCGCGRRGIGREDSRRIEARASFPRCRSRPSRSRGRAYLKTGSAKNGLFFRFSEVCRHGVGREGLSPHQDLAARDVEGRQPDEIRKGLGDLIHQAHGALLVRLQRVDELDLRPRGWLSSSSYSFTSSMMDFRRSASRRALTISSSSWLRA